MAKTLIRNPKLIQATMKELPDGRVLCSQDLRLQVPVRYTECNLAQISIETIVYGVCALILPSGDYSVMRTNAMLNINPSKITKTEIDGVEYYEFFFVKGSVWLNNSSLVKQTTSIYFLINELIAHGKIPWYIEYDDLGRLLDSAKESADSNVASSYTAVELIASLMSRNPKDLQQDYRHITKTSKTKPKYVPLSSVYYSANNTFNKIAGSYFNDGVVAALVNPSQTTERVDRLLRA